MGYIRELIQQLEEERILPRKELTVLLEEHTPEDDRYLYERADRLRRLSFGNQICAEPFEHQFRMVAARQRFCHLRGRIRIESCQKNGGFYLCGSHGGGVGDAV